MSLEMMSKWFTVDKVHLILYDLLLSMYKWQLQTNYFA